MIHFKNLEGNTSMSQTHFRTNPGIQELWINRNTCCYFCFCFRYFCCCCCWWPSHGPAHRLNKIPLIPSLRPRTRIPSKPSFLGLTHSKSNQFTGQNGSCFPGPSRVKWCHKDTSRKDFTTTWSVLNTTKTVFLKIHSVCSMLANIFPDLWGCGLVLTDPLFNSQLMSLLGVATKRKSLFSIRWQSKAFAGHLGAPQLPHLPPMLLTKTKEKTMGE